MEEEWRPVVGYEGRYEVSDQGRVRSWVNSRGNPRSVPRVRKPFLSSYGYPSLHLTSGSRESKETLRVHRLVTEAFMGACPEGHEVRHLDGDPGNASLPNLVYGTKSQNMLDKQRHGTDHQIVKTHCPRRHAYTPENTYHRPDRPGRMCRTCQRDRRR